MKAYASQESIAETLTAVERMRDGTAERLDRALGNGWRQPDELNEPLKTVYLLLPGEIVVRGWLSTRFRSRPRSFWTWDGRFGQKTADGQLLPSLVSPLAWCEIEGGGP